MTRAIMGEWLIELDGKKKILLFLDNAASHPRELHLINVNIIFLPPNRNCVCQLDRGVIQVLLLQSYFIKHGLC